MLGVGSQFNLPTIRDLYGNIMHPYYTLIHYGLDGILEQNTALDIKM